MKKYAYAQIEMLADKVREMSLKSDVKAVDQLIETTIKSWPRSLQCKLAGIMADHTNTDEFEWLDATKAYGYEDEKYSPTYTAQAVLLLLNGFEGINFDINLSFWQDYEDVSEGTFRNAIIDSFTQFDVNRFFLLRIEHSGDINAQVIALVWTNDIEEDMSYAHIKFAQSFQGGEFHEMEGKFEVDGTFQTPIEMKEILNDEYNAIKHLLKPKEFNGMAMIDYDESEVQAYLDSQQVKGSEL